MLALWAIVVAVIATIWPVIPPLAATVASLCAIVFYLRAMKKLPK